MPLQARWANTSPALRCAARPGSIVRACLIEILGDPLVIEASAMFEILGTWRFVGARTLLRSVAAASPMDVCADVTFPRDVLKTTSQLCFDSPSILTHSGIPLPLKHTHHVQKRVRDLFLLRRSNTQAYKTQYNALIQDETQVFRATFNPNSAPPHISPPHAAHRADRAQEVAARCRQAPRGSRDAVRARQHPALLPAHVRCVDTAPDSRPPLPRLLPSRARGPWRHALRHQRRESHGPGVRVPGRATAVGNRTC